MFDILGPGGVLALLVLGGVIGFVVLFRFPELMIAVLLVGQGFIHFAFKLMGMQVSRVGFAVAGSVLFLPMVVLLVLGRVMGKGRGQQEPPFFGRASGMFILMLLALGLLLTAGLGYTHAPIYGGKKVREFLTFGVGPFFLAFLFIRDLKSVRRLMWWTMLMAGFFVGISVLYSVKTTGQLFTSIRYGEGTFLGPFEVYSGLELGVRMVVFFQSLLVMGWAARHRVWRVAVTPVLLFIAAAVMSAGARSALLGIFLLVPMTVKMLYRGRWGVPAIGAGLLLLVMAGYFVWAPESAKERFIEPLTGKGSAAVSIERRSGAFGTAARMIVSRPIQGYGTGGFAMEFEKLDIETYAHNMWLSVWAENGVFGFGLVMGMWIMLGLHLWRSYRAVPSGTIMFYAVCWVAGLVVAEFVNDLVHYDIAHAASTFLLVSGIALKIVALNDHEMSLKKADHPTSSLQAGKLRMRD